MDKKQNNKNKTAEMYNKIVESVTKIISSGEYEKFLKFSKNFHNYSFKNIVLIFSQMENATQVAGFKTWQKMSRKLKKGAKGIQIFYPIKRKCTTIECQNSIIDGNSDNENNKQEKITEFLIYRPTYVFDISQTVGESLPLDDERLNNNTMQEFFDFLNSYSPYPILEKELEGGTQGYWSPKNKHIVLKKALSIDDKTSVLLHELTHALYDDFDYKKDRNLSESFVESVAFIVADNFGLDTSCCSFNYITSYLNGDVKILLELGDKIQKSANDFISKLETEFDSKNIRVAM